MDGLSGGICDCDVAVYAWETVLEELDWRSDMLGVLRQELLVEILFSDK
jgi:hypothetical protein